MKPKKKTIKGFRNRRCALPGIAKSRKGAGAHIPKKVRVHITAKSKNNKTGMKISGLFKYCLNTIFFEKKQF